MARDWITLTGTPTEEGLNQPLRVRKADIALVIYNFDHFGNAHISFTSGSGMLVTDPAEIAALREMTEAPNGV